MEKNLFRYIWNHTSRQQLYILVIVLISMPTYFMSLDLPKQIVNGPIQGNGFETPDAHQTFLRIAFDLPLVGKLVLFPGIELNRFSMLMALSGFFLFLVIVNGLFKFYINTYKGRLGERMLRRIRYELIDRVLRFPPSYFKRVKASEIATMIKDEVEPLGGFIGDAFVSPALIGGQAVTALVFIIVQNFWLGMLAAATIGLQGFIIPRLRRKQILLGRERQLTARELAGRVGEIVDGVAAIHVNDTSNYERADIAARLGRIFKIRYDLYQWKFFVKFLNNFISQVTPYLFYAIGGYLALRGQLDVGQLVAVIAAYKDLPAPIKDLIDWDQMRLDVQVKYSQVTDQFTVDGLLDPALQEVRPERVPPIEAPIAVTNLSALDDSGARLIDKTSLQIAPGERVAIAGAAGSGGDALAEALVRLVIPDGGRVSVGNMDLYQLPEAVTGRRFAYASSDAHLMQGTFGDNLLYVLKHAPLREGAYEGEAAKHRQWEIEEARKAGNPQFDFGGDWIDHEALGLDDPAKLFDAMRHALDAAGLSQDVFELGLRTFIDPARYPAIAEGIDTARQALRHRLDTEGLTGFVVSFDPQTYNKEATLAENLVFGAPLPPLTEKALAATPYLRSVIARFGLDERLYRMGYEIARTVVDLFRDLPPDHPFFEQLTFMPPEEIPAYEALVQKYRDRAYAEVPEGDRERISGLSFAYIEPRHRFGLLDDELMNRIVQARGEFRSGLPPELAGQIEFYDPKQYNKASNLLNNVLFGRIAYERVDAAEKVFTIARQVLEEQGLADDVFAIGLKYNVGVGGKRLTMAQRQKLHVARALMKRADVLIFNRPLASLDLRTQENILQRILKETGNGSWRPAILWVVNHPSFARFFDRVVVFDGPSMAEQGKYDDLSQGKGLLTALAS